MSIIGFLKHIDEQFQFWIQKYGEYNGCTELKDYLDTFSTSELLQAMLEYEKEVLGVESDYYIG